MSEMQAPFFENEEFMKSFRNTLSEPRFARYIKEGKGDQTKAIYIYQWNAFLSQSMYLPLQTCEIAFRNKMNAFLCWKFNSKWPYDERALRQLKGHTRKKLEECMQRQKTDRNTQVPSTDMIVADLSVGFWVSLLSSSYDASLSYRHNIRRVFPHDSTLTREATSKICNGLLNIRNRVAHHEPVYHLPLREHLSDLNKLLEAMCPGSYAYATGTSTLDSILRDDPRKVDYRATGRVSDRTTMFLPVMPQA